MKYLIITLPLSPTLIIDYFPSIITITFLLIIGFIIHRLATYFLLLKKEICILKEENQYFIDSFQSIRTPITLIHTPLNSICNDNCPEYIKKELLLAIQNIDCVNDHLTRLTNMRQVVIHPETMNIAEYELGNFVKNRVYSLKDHAATKRMKLEIESQFSYASTWLDQTKISPVIEKFIKNAIDYGEPQKNITFFVSISPLHWEIKTTFSEKGELIKCYECKKRNPLKSNTCSTYHFAESIMCKKLAEQCKGEIIVNNMHHTISLKFPIINSISSDLKYKSAVIEENNSEIKIDTLFGKNKNRNSIKPVVMLVESDDEFRAYLETCLSRDYIVKSHQNGSEALTSIVEEHPDLVICDTVLHEMSGIELSSRLKTSGKTSIIPIILYGSNIDTYQRNKREASLADTYLHMPFHIEELKIEMTVLIKNSRFLRKSFLQKVFGEQFLKAITDESAKESDDKFLNQVKEYVLENINNEELTINDIASYLCMSRTAFYNQWKALTGEAPKFFIFRVRMEKAHELLASGKYSVQVVPEMIGLKNLKNFRDRYKKYFGITPSETSRKG